MVRPRPHRRRADEFVPVHVSGQWRFRRAGHDFRRLGPDRPIGPDVRLAHGPDEPRLHRFDGAAQPARRRTLIAHLRGDAHFGRGLAHEASFVDRVRQRLLRVDVLLHLHRGDAGDGVRMIGSAHGDRIDLFAHLVEHFSPIEVFLGIRELLGLGSEMLFIDIAERDYRAELAALRDVAGAFAADADAREADRVVRAVGGARRGQRAGRKEVPGAGRGRGLQETPARDASAHEECSPEWRAGGWRPKAIVNGVCVRGNGNGLIRSAIRRL